MAGLSGSVIELSNYLEQRIFQKSSEYAAVSVISCLLIYFVMFAISTVLEQIKFILVPTFPLSVIYSLTYLNCFLSSFSLQSAASFDEVGKVVLVGDGENT